MTVWEANSETQCQPCVRDGRTADILSHALNKLHAGLERPETSEGQEESVAYGVISELKKPLAAVHARSVEMLYQCYLSKKNLGLMHLRSCSLTYCSRLGDPRPVIGSGIKHI